MRWEYEMQRELWRHSLDQSLLLLVRSAVLELWRRRLHGCRELLRGIVLHRFRLHERVVLVLLQAGPCRSRGGYRGEQPLEVPRLL